MTSQDSTTLVNEIYAVQREIAGLEKKKKELQFKLLEQMSAEDTKTVFGDEVGYSLSFSETGVKYQLRVWEILGKKAEYFRPVPAITKTKIQELLQQGKLTEHEVQQIESCKEVSDNIPVFTQIMKEIVE